MHPPTIAPPQILGVGIPGAAAGPMGPAGVPMPPTSTESVGMIIPPADIRSIIEKTAQFVAKNGPEFEQRVLLDKGADQKFAFLLPGNPYRPYYDAKVKEFLTGEVNEATRPQIPKAILEMRRREAEKKEQKERTLALTAYATEPLIPAPGQRGEGLLKLTDFAATLQAAPETRLMAIDDGRPPDPPAEDQYTATRPFAAALDIDVIKLTAQYVARNGQKFLAGLGQRERGNAQFAFLRATHPLFSYFTALVDAYTRVLMPDKATLSRLKEDVGVAGRFTSGAADTQQPGVKPTDVLQGPQALPPHQMTAMLGVLERVAARQRWEDYEERRKQEKAKEEAEDRQQMHALDWHEFVVVEVINFSEEDDKLLLGPPLEPSQLTQPPVIPPLAPEQAEQYATAAPVGPSPLPVSQPVPVPTVPPPPVPPVIPAEVTVPPSITAGGPASLAPQPHVGGFSDGPPESATPASVPIVVVSDYVRQPRKRARQAAVEGTMKCPITGQWVKADNMSAHLRILLLDPKWKEQKDQLLAKAQKESAFAPGDDFEANLANFVVKRPDLFGTVEDECESTYVPPPKRK